MLRICEEFAAEYAVKFNSSKSLSLSFNLHEATPPIFQLADDNIPVEISAVHLGSRIGKDSHQKNIGRISKDLYVSTNKIIHLFRSSHFTVRTQLFQTYCSSFYGSPLLNLDKIESLAICWRKCIRSLFRLHPRTHRALIPHIVRRPNINVELQRRFIKFWVSCCTNENDILRMCAMMCNRSTSVAAGNLRLVLANMSINFDLARHMIPNLPTRFDASRVADEDEDERMATADAIVELWRMRSGELFSVLDHAECCRLLEHLCIGPA